MAGRLVGVLDGSDRRNLRLTYDDGWISDPAATPVSVSMPVGAKHYSGKVVEPYLWGLLPDNDRVLARWAADYQCSANSVFDLLRHVGADVAGAAQYIPPGAAADEARPGKLDALAPADVATMLREVREDATVWHPSSHPGRWSLAGAQGKIALAYDAERAAWGLPSGTMPTTHILKPAIAGLDGHDLNEHLCLAAAGRLGLRVAHTEVTRFDDERALVVQRYDRVSMPDGRLIRVHQEDLCQALSVHPVNKYQADGGPGVEQMAAALRASAAGDATRDVDALCRAVAFNWLVLGTDAHAKNYSLLLSGRQVRLAPLYDIASAAAYDGHPRRLRMAQKIGGEYRPTVIASRHWSRLAKTVGIDGTRLQDDIVSMIERLPDALSDAVAGTDINERESASAAKLLDAIAGWASTCRSAMQESTGNDETPGL